MSTSTHTSTSTSASAHGQTLLLAGVLVIATNLRAPFTGLPPVLGLVSKDFGLGTTMAGLITTLPLLAFALLSPVSAALGRKWGLTRALFAGLLIIALGIGVRSLGTYSSLFLGTTLIGMGIAVGNVLLPSLIKRSFPGNITALTGAYALTMGIAATLASIAVVPVSNQWGWQKALASLIVLPIVALILWLPQLATGPDLDSKANGKRLGSRMWRSPLAWQVTLFLGLNSLISYIAIGWLPTILIDSKLSAEQAGSMHGVLQFAIAVPGILIAPVVRRMRDQRLPAAISAGCMAAGFLGLIFAPHQGILWPILLGIGSGASFILGLAFIGLRTRDAAEAAALSGMAQCVGYLLAAVGPVAMGALHDATGGWHIPLGLCAALALLDALLGLLAGRNQTVA